MSLIGNCNTPDFIFPMTAEVFYPMVEQNAYGGVSKTWVLDKSVIGNFSPAGSGTREEVVPNVNITQNTLLICRVKSDLRVSSSKNQTSVTNVIVTNIKDSLGNEIYLETAGPRAGKSTIFEIATQEAQIDPFGGGVQYYKLVLRRSDNQGADA